MLFRTSSVLNSDQSMIDSAFPAGTAPTTPLSITTTTTICLGRKPTKERNQRGWNINFCFLINYTITAMSVGRWQVAHSSLFLLIALFEIFYDASLTAAVKYKINIDFDSFLALYFPKLAVCWRSSCSSSVVSGSILLCRTSCECVFS